MVEEILTPEVIATIIGLILTVGGGTAAGIIIGLRKYLIRGRDFTNILIDVLEDGRITGEEVKRITDGFLKLIEKNPEVAKQLLNKKG